MTLRALFAVLLCLLWAGCGSVGLVAAKPEVDVEIVNRSSRDLENAQVRFGNHACDWGWVVKTATKGYLYYPDPITTEAELHWDEDGKHRVEKIDLSKIYPPGKSGRLTFTVHDGRADVSFRIQ